MVPVDIFVKTDDLIPIPIEGAVVTVLDPGSSATLGESLTDENGRAAFLLSGTVSPGNLFEVRFYKRGVVFRNPLAIQVLDPASAPSTNQFDVSASAPTLPAATDPRVCRCTGRFMSFSNQPIADVTVRFEALPDTGTQTPKVVDGNMISAQSMEVLTDTDGFVSVDLVRGGRFNVTFSGDDDTIWPILIPDRSSANLVELVHPQPVHLYWDSTVVPDPNISLRVGDSLSIPISLLFSDFEVLTEGLSTWIALTSSDVQIATVVLSNDRVVLTGVRAGQATVVPGLVPGLMPKRVPTYSITAASLIVTVTET